MFQDACFRTCIAITWLMCVFTAVIIVVRCEVNFPIELAWSFAKGFEFPMPVFFATLAVLYAALVTVLATIPWFALLCCFPNAKSRFFS